MNENTLDFSITRLGNGGFRSPMQGVRFTEESDHVVYHSSMDDIRKYLAEGKEPPSMAVAGPREQIFHNPETLTCGIVTCGGICPGLNDVIRSIVQVTFGFDTAVSEAKRASDAANNEAEAARDSGFC